MATAQLIFNLNFILLCPYKPNILFESLGRIIFQTINRTAATLLYKSRPSRDSNPSRSLSVNPFCSPCGSQKALPENTLCSAKGMCPLWGPRLRRVFGISPVNTSKVSLEVFSRQGSMIVRYTTGAAAKSAGALGVSPRMARLKPPGLVVGILLVF